MSLTFTQAQQILNTSFIAHTSVGTVELRLIEASELPGRGIPTEFRMPMVLIFSAPASPVLTQDNYHIDHPQLGRQYWAMSPVQPPRNPPVTVNNEPLLFYQVLFN
ncbi:DUF6916 family protein [Undibacterium flavidum]|uniref:DUF6916 domain-containing protein n=1 Tax=Undibacterium flavidum TaxID=2762297 RepID=A0ABR6YAL0_9BURK|nr:hypothetical protein [Undibacterium flavidum]MBC3873670.1 hypothetical protein [Undibacterium flavidum]